MAKKDKKREKKRAEKRLAEKNRDETIKDKRIYLLAFYEAIHEKKREDKARNDGRVAVG